MGHRPGVVPLPGVDAFQRGRELLRKPASHDDTRHVSRVSDSGRRAGTIGVVRLLRPLLVVLPLVLSACGGLDDAAAETIVTAVVDDVPPSLSTTTTALSPNSTTASETLPPLTTTTIPPDQVWTAAFAEGRLPVFASPQDPRPHRVLDSHTILGTPTVVFVLAATDAWLHVMLPGRPNGETAWIRSRDVVTYEVTTRAVVDLTNRTLQVFEGDRQIFETAIGVGSPASPTPTGMFFITDAVRITNPGGPWGPYAFGLSARSDTVTEFNGGDGIIGIHGTNRPNSIGEAQSLGCVRLPNDVMLQLSELLSVGSPVKIRA